MLAYRRARHTSPAAGLYGVGDGVCEVPQCAYEGEDLGYADGGTGLVRL